MKNLKETKLTPIESALQGQCKNGEELVQAFYSVEEKRGQWLASAIMFGLWASVMKAEIGHGKFLPWLRDVFKKFKCATRCTFDEESIRTAQFYMSMARKLLSQIEEPHLNSEIGLKVHEICALNEIPKEKLPEIFKDKKKTMEIVSSIVDGYSLRSLNYILTEANRITYKEEVNEELSCASKTKRAIPSNNTQSVQFKLWEDWTNELRNIDTLLRDPAKDQLEPEHWIKIERALEAQLAEIRKITRQF